MYPDSFHDFASDEDWWEDKAKTVLIMASDSHNASSTIMTEPGGI